MINFDFKKSCYSCTACSSVCPEKAISFDEFLLPVIDKEKCIQCGACDNVCIKMQESEYCSKLVDEAKGYVCKSINDEIRKNSSSGGVFFHLASSFIAAGGYVCGCLYDQNFMPQHVLTNDLDVVKQMMGSKYVQSDLGECLIEMKKVLNENKKVLFSGVPCQVAAVKAIVKKNLNNLLLVGVVCHGSISRELWKSYLAVEEQHGKIQSVTMRDKSKGWLNYGLRIRFQNGLEYITFRKQNGYFLKCYTDGIMERDRCLSCNYKGNRIFSDILLGDGWGMDKVFPELDDQYGISSVICLTEKGTTVLEDISDKIEMRKINVQTILKCNQRIISSPQENIERRKFHREYMKAPDKIHEICKKYAVPTILSRMKKKIISVFRC